MCSNDHHLLLLSCMQKICTIKGKKHPECSSLEQNVAFFFFLVEMFFSFYFFPNLFYLLKLFSVPFTNSLVIYSFKFILSVFECFFLFSFFFYLPHFTPSSLCFVRRLAIMSICLYVSTVHWICQKKP